MMCHLIVMDHSSQFGCGHVCVTGIGKCDKAVQRPDQQPCVIVTQRRFRPYSQVWRKYMIYVGRTLPKVAGPCEACQDDGWPNFF